MIAIAPWQTESKGAAKMLMQVHDELVFSIDDAFLDEAIPVIRDKMENVLSLSVPLVVQVGQGKNWDEAH